METTMHKMGNERYKSIADDEVDCCTSGSSREFIEPVDMNDAKKKQLMLKTIPNLLKEHFNDVSDLDALDDGKFATLISNLEDMIQKFIEFTEAGEVFVAAFPSWKEKRSKSTEGLKKVVESLNTHRLNSNISRLTSSIVGIIGGFITISGVVLLPMSFGISTPLIIGGAATAGTGGAANFGTAIAETVLTRNLIRDAKDLIKEDEKEFQCFSQWFKHGAGFVESVTKILDYNIFVRILEDVSKIQKSFSREDNGKATTLKQLVDYILECCEKQELEANLSVKMTFMVVIAFLHPKQLKLMLYMHRNNPIVFEAIMTSSRILFQVARMTDAGVDVANAVASVIKGGAAISKPVVAVVVNSVFAGLGVALDVLTMVLTSIDVHRGSENEQSKMIKAVVETFEEELNVLSQLNEELKKDKLLSKLI